RVFRIPQRGKHIFPEVRLRANALRRQDIQKSKDIFLKSILKVLAPRILIADKFKQGCFSDMWLSNDSNRLPPGKAAGNMVQLHLAAGKFNRRERTSIDEGGEGGGHNIAVLMNDSPF